MTAVADPSDDRPLLLYGILAAGEPDPVSGGAGVHGAPLALHECGDLAVLASPLSDPDVVTHPDVDTVLRYKEIIDAAYETRTLVPLRFGTRVRSPAAACALLAERAEACRAHLDRFEGRVEMGLRLTHRTADEASGEAREATSGTAYLRARKRQHDRIRAPLADALRRYREATAPQVVEAAADERPEGGTLSAAFLVPRSSVEPFRRRVAEATAPAGIDTQVVGPWAPFTFASLTF
jgi:hypothetical protein